jgi:glyoxylase-like metal-dependent hydrolase (beta-lactamase superfamily II)
VLLRLRGREALLTGDAAYLKRTIDESITPLLPHDEHKFFRSLKEIQRYVERTPEALVIPGHDRDVWPTLAPVYE